MIDRIAILALIAGCRVTDHFPCERNDQCTHGNEMGVCAPEGCAFVDPACSSGYRFDDSALDDVAGTCVGTGDPPIGCKDWRPQHFDPCAIPKPLGPFSLTGGVYVYNTDTGQFDNGPSPASIVIPQSNPPGPSIRVISVDGFRIETDAQMLAGGSLPLVIASWKDIVMFGPLDVSSSVSTRKGAGHSPTDGCTATAGSDNGAGGGGGGGAGKGGAGASATSPLAVGGTGGTAVVPMAILGGCAGAASGAGGSFAKPPALPTSIGFGGEGGGAILLSAQMGIGADAINAGGGAGFGSPFGSSAGGGGGGAGGMIAFEAPSVAVRLLSANGGGGGGGGDNVGMGNPGASGGTTMTAAPGGAPNTGCSTAGGNGAAGTVMDGVAAAAFDCMDSASHGSGGGGGGSVGFILVKSPMFVKATGAVISPMERITP